MVLGDKPLISEVVLSQAPNVVKTLLAAWEEALLWTLAGARGLSFIHASGSPQ
jgi:hypothetical protein